MNKKKIWRIVIAFVVGVVTLIVIKVVVSILASDAEDALTNTSLWHPGDKVSKTVDYCKMTGIDWAVTLFSIYLGIKLLIWFVKKIAKEFVDGESKSKEIEQ